MTFSPDSPLRFEQTFVDLNHRSEDAQRISVQVGNQMNQFNLIRDAVIKCTVDLPYLAFDFQQSSNKTQIIQNKENKEIYGDNTPDKNDGYMLADDPMDKFRQDTNAHNKKVFDEVDTDHSGKLSLKELEAATSAAKSDLTYNDLENLNRQEYNMLKKLGIAGESNTHKFDLDLPEFLIENRSKY